MTKVKITEDIGGGMRIIESLMNIMLLKNIIQLDLFYCSISLYDALNLLLYLLVLQVQTHNKNTIAQRLRIRNMNLYGKNRVPPEKYMNRGRKVHCSSECGSVWYPHHVHLAYQRGLKKMIFTAI